MLAITLAHMLSEKYTVVKRHGEFAHQGIGVRKIIGLVKPRLLAKEMDAGYIVLVLASTLLMG